MLEAGSTATDCDVDVSVAGGPYANVDGGETLHLVVSTTVCAFQSYTFTVFDREGDGMTFGGVGDAKDFGGLVGTFQLTLNGEVVATGDG